MTENMDYPAIYKSASRSSWLGQQRFVKATRIRLVALVAAALGGAAAWSVGEVDVFGWVALVAFLAALASEFYILTIQPERLWYEGRAAAESAKTLAWRYAVGGNPFAVSLGTSGADKLLLARLDDILTDLDRLPPTPPESGGDQITLQMRQLRSSRFGERKAQYLNGRVTDQENWYSNKASYNEELAHLFTWLTIILEFVGVIGATLKAFSVLGIDLLGVLGAGAAGLTAWGQARQYSFNARAYSIAFHELVSIRAEIEHIDEPGWPRFVEEAEEAISREHTLWRASKGIRPIGLRRRSMRDA